MAFHTHFLPEKNQNSKHVDNRISNRSFKKGHWNSTESDGQYLKQERSRNWARLARIGLLLRLPSQYGERASKRPSVIYILIIESCNSSHRRALGSLQDLMTFQKVVWWHCPREAHARSHTYPESSVATGRWHFRTPTIDCTLSRSLALSGMRCKRSMDCCPRA